QLLREGAARYQHPLVAISEELAKESNDVAERVPGRALRGRSEMRAKLARDLRPRGRRDLRVGEHRYREDEPLDRLSEPEPFLVEDAIGVARTFLHTIPALQRSGNEPEPDSPDVRRALRLLVEVRFSVHVIEGHRRSTTR